MLVLTPIAWELRPYPRLSRHRKSCCWSWSFFGLAEEVCWVEDDYFSLDVSAEAESVDLFFLLESFSSFFFFSQGHLESILQVLEDDYSIAFASALTTFLTASSQESKSWPWVSNWAWTKSLKHFQKYRIMISLFGVIAGSNSWRTTSNCSKWAAQLRTSSN